MEVMTIVHQKEIHRCAEEHGWWVAHRPIPELLCLIHSEVSEALEAYRKGLAITDKDGIAEELADIIIRVFDMAEHYGIDIAHEVECKHFKNIRRPYRHGDKVC
jgi:NTP pyrophosphatase (non-canonical NTP hydrolase)